jgi:hypothetical protein
MKRFVFIAVFTAMFLYPISTNATTNLYFYDFSGTTPDPMPGWSKISGSSVSGFYIVPAVPGAWLYCYGKGFPDFAGNAFYTIDAGSAWDAKKYKFTWYYKTDNGTANGDLIVILAQSDASHYYKLIRPQANFGAYPWTLSVVGDSQTWTDEIGSSFSLSDGDKFEFSVMDGAIYADQNGSSTSKWVLSSGTQYTTGSCGLGGDVVGQATVYRQFEFQTSISVDTIDATLTPTESATFTVTPTVTLTPTPTITETPTPTVTVGPAMPIPIWTLGPGESLSNWTQFNAPGGTLQFASTYTGATLTAGGNSSQWYKTSSVGGTQYTIIVTGNTVIASGSPHAFSFPFYSSAGNYYDLKKEANSTTAFTIFGAFPLYSGGVWNITTAVQFQHQAGDIYSIFYTTNSVVVYRGSQLVLDADLAAGTQFPTVAFGLGAYFDMTFTVSDMAVYPYITPIPTADTGGPTATPVPVPPILMADYCEHADFGGHWAEGHQASMNGLWHFIDGYNFDSMRYNSGTMLMNWQYISGTYEMWYAMRGFNWPDEYTYSFKVVSTTSYSCTSFVIFGVDMPYAQPPYMMTGFTGSCSFGAHVDGSTDVISDRTGNITFDYNIPLSVSPGDTISTHTTSTDISIYLIHLGVPTLWAHGTKVHAGQSGTVMLGIGETGGSTGSTAQIEFDDIIVSAPSFTPTATPPPIVLPTKTPTPNAPFAITDTYTASPTSIIITTPTITPTYPTTTTTITPVVPPTSTPTRTPTPGQTKTPTPSATRSPTTIITTLTPSLTVTRTWTATPGPTPVPTATPYPTWDLFIFDNAIRKLLLGGH